MNTEINTLIDEITKSFLFKDANIDEKALKLGGLREYILKILLNSKFIIGPQTQELVNMIESKVDISLKSDLPITIVPAIGGFKNYRCLSFPEIDLAELMQLQFLISRLISISKIYEPGLIIEYTLDAQAMTVADNYKPEDIDTYISGFRLLLSQIQKILPSNIVLKMTSFYDFYTIEELELEINKRLLEVKKENQYQTLINERIIHAKNDFVFDGWKDFTKVTQAEKNKLLAESVWKHKLWLKYDYEKRADYIEGGERIPVGHRKFPGLLPIKSINGSDIQFWVSNLIFKNIDEEWRPTLVTPNMTEKFKIKIHNLEEGIFKITPLNRLYISN